VAVAVEVSAGARLAIAAASDLSHNPLDEKRKQQLHATHRLFSRGADRGTGGSASFSVAVVVGVSAGAGLAMVAASDLSQQHLDKKRKQQIQALKSHRLSSRREDRSDREAGGSVSFSVAVVVEVSAGARLAMAAASSLCLNSSG
jgi:hypothetical protein